MTAHARLRSSDAAVPAIHTCSFARSGALKGKIETRSDVRHGVASEGRPELGDDRGVEVRPKAPNAKQPVCTSHLQVNVLKDEQSKVGINRNSAKGTSFVL